MPTPESKTGTYWITTEPITAGHVAYKCVVYLYPNALELDAEPVSPSNTCNRLHQHEVIIGKQVPETSRLVTLATLCAIEAVAFKPGGVNTHPTELPKMIQTEIDATKDREEQRPRFSQYCHAWVWRV